MHKELYEKPVINSEELEPGALGVMGSPVGNGGSNGDNGGGGIPHWTWG